MYDTLSMHIENWTNYEVFKYWIGPGPIDFKTFSFSSCSFYQLHFIWWCCMMSSYKLFLLLWEDSFVMNMNYLNSIFLCGMMNKNRMSWTTVKHNSLSYNVAWQFCLFWKKCKQVVFRSSSFHMHNILEKMYIRSNFYLYKYT